MMRKVFVDFVNGFGIAAAPKVGTKSVVDFLFEMRHGRPPATEEAFHRHAEDWGLSHTAAEGFDARIPIIAIHRDPYERLRSAYQHRVVNEREAPAHTFREFCERLGEFRELPMIAWHTDSQVEWLGPTMELYAASLGLEDLHLLPALLRRLTGRDFPAMSWAHRMREKPAWEDGLRELLAPWVADDLAAGWNGKTAKEVFDLVILARSVEQKEVMASMLDSRRTVISLEKYRDEKDWGWYRMVPAAWLRWVASRHPVKALEVGAFDGVSANVMLDAIFPHPESTVNTIDPYLPDPSTREVCTETRVLFEENTRRGDHQDRVKLHVGTSREVLTRMLVDGEYENYDMVFIDGSHLATDVLTDAILTWPLLKPGGILVFDDFEWGGKVAKHQRPREAVLACEAAFVESLVPLWRGYQRIYRKIGVPGGLKNSAGDLLHLNVVIVGVYESGSTILSAVMECLGFSIGRPAWHDFFESASLRELLISAFDEEKMEPKMDSEQLVVELRKWLGRVKPSAPSLCLNHPFLSLCLAEIYEAWGPETVFLRVERPLEDATHGLQSRGWLAEPERIQHLLHEEIETFFSVGIPFLSVKYNELMADPVTVIQTLAGALGFKPTEIVVERAAQMIRATGD